MVTVNTNTRLCISLSALSVNHIIAPPRSLPGKSPRAPQSSSVGTQSIMDGNTTKLAELMTMLDGHDGANDSRATSPGLGSRHVQDVEEDLTKVTRNRPRKYPYFRYLPYEVESEAKRHEGLEEILKQLYISIEAGDLTVGALYWTRELRNWLGLKFDPTKDERIRLIKLYYELALAPGVDPTAAERFSSTFMVLTK